MIGGKRMKIILRSNCGELQSEHDIPPSEVEAFVALCRNHDFYDGINDPGIRGVVTQMCLGSGEFEIIIDDWV